MHGKDYPDRLLMELIDFTTFRNKCTSCVYVMQLTLSRPKGPAARKRPRRASAPPGSSNPVTSPSSKSDASSTNSTTIAGQGANVKIMIDSEQQEEIEKPPSVQCTVNVSQRNDKDKVTPDVVAITPAPALQQKQTEKAKEERARVKSAPETLPTTEEKKPVVLQEVLANGEDESDRREHEKRKSSQDARKRSSLKVSIMPA